MVALRGGLFLMSEVPLYWRRCPTTPSNQSKMNDDGRGRGRRIHIMIAGGESAGRLPFCSSSLLPSSLELSDTQVYEP